MTAIVLCKDICSAKMRIILTALLEIEHSSSEKAACSKRRMNYQYCAQSMSPSSYLATTKSCMSSHRAILGKP